MLTHSFTHLRYLSPTRSLIRSLVHSLLHSFTHSLTCSLAVPVHNVLFEFVASFKESSIFRCVGDNIITINNSNAHVKVNLTIIVTTSSASSSASIERSTGCRIGILLTRYYVVKLLGGGLG